jgi:hypothetical protein
VFSADKPTGTPIVEVGIDVGGQIEAVNAAFDDVTVDAQ